MNQWDEMYASTLGTVEEVKEQVSSLYPSIIWKRGEEGWVGLGPNHPNEPYLEISLSEKEPKKCFFVMLNKAPPSVIRKIMEAMNLNYVCAPESGDLVDPYGYDDTDRYYAKKMK